MTDYSYFQDIPKLSLNFLEKLKQDSEYNFFPVINSPTKIGKKICSDYEIIRIEDIVYPSETVGRELHLDRHDKSQHHSASVFLLTLLEALHPKSLLPRHRQPIGARHPPWLWQYH